ncbi:hypothetical protein, partial [Bradyrhizobium genomosp. III]|uniref:hypothetical protein n=1 Tax=Bradyrhizobium genomosp. III TaxID=2683271 RepID=UPI001AEBDFCD
QQRPYPVVVVGGFRQFLRRRPCDWHRRCRSQRQAQTFTLQIHCGRPDEILEISIHKIGRQLNQIATRPRWRGHSQIVRVL